MERLFHISLWVVILFQFLTEGVFKLKSPS